MMTSKARKTRAQFAQDTAWTPALAAGAVLTALHVYDHGIIGGILSISQVAAVIVVAMLFGLFRRKPRQGVAIWLGRFLGYGLLGMIYQTIVGGLATVAGVAIIQGIDGLNLQRHVLILTLEAVGFVAIAAPGVWVAWSRPRAGAAVASEDGVTAG